MQELPASALTSGKKTVFLWGPPKTHKTRCAATFPKPLRLYDLENGALSVAGMPGATDITIVRFGTKSADKIGLSQKTTPSKDPFLDFVNDFNRLYDLPADKLPKTVVVDGLSELSNMAMEYVLSMNSRQIPEFQDWGQAINKIKEVIRAGVGLPCNFVFIAHDQAEKDDVLGSIHIAPAVFGKSLPREIGRFFDDVFYTKIEKDVKGEPVPKLLTVADGMVSGTGARSKALPRLIDANFQAIYGGSAA